MEYEGEEHEDYYDDEDEDYYDDDDEYFDSEEECTKVDCDCKVLLPLRFFGIGQRELWI